jgi:hypothetical protein
MYKALDLFPSIANKQIKIKYIVLYIFSNSSNLEHRQHQMLTRIWSNRNSPSLLIGIQNGMAALGVSFRVSYKTMYTVIMFLDVYPKKLKTHVHMKPTHGCL